MLDHNYKLVYFHQSESKQFKNYTYEQFNNYSQAKIRLELTYVKTLRKTEEFSICAFKENYSPNYVIGFFNYTNKPIKIYHVGGRKPFTIKLDEVVVSKSKGVFLNEATGKTSKASVCYGAFFKVDEFDYKTIYTPSAFEHLICKKAYSNNQRDRWDKKQDILKKQEYKDFCKDHEGAKVLSLCSSFAALDYEQSRLYSLLNRKPYPISISIEGCEICKLNPQEEFFIPYKDVSTENAKLRSVLKNAVKSTNRWKRKRKLYKNESGVSQNLNINRDDDWLSL